MNDTPKVPRPSGSVKPTNSALWVATRDNARANARAVIHTKDCPTCPIDLGGFLDAPLFRLCELGRGIRDEIAATERAIARAVSQPNAAVRELVS
jgi:hypothetical protein